MKGLNDLMKQAQAMQERMQEMQKEIGSMEITGESGAGLVRITVNGLHEARRVQIDESLLSEDKDVLEDLIAAAFNDCARKVEQARTEKMGAMASGLGLPLDKLPF